MRHPVGWDPYTVLGVGPSASVDEIRAAWKAGVRRYHPDIAPGHLVADYTERTRRLNMARDLLLTPGFRPCPSPPGPVPGPPVSAPPPAAVPAPPMRTVAASTQPWWARLCVMWEWLVLVAVWAFRLLVAWCVLEVAVGLVWLVVQVMTR